MADTTKKYLDLSGLTTLVQGIKTGALVAGKAANDVSGRSITETYATKAEIEALDADLALGKSGGTQYVMTGIKQVDGQITEVEAAVLDGTDITYTKGTSETGPLSAATTVDEALKTLAAKASAQELAAADKSVVIGTAEGKTTVKVNIKSGEKVIKLDSTSDGGIYTNINLVKITDDLPATTKERYELRDSDNVKIGESIDIAKDSHIVSITYISNSADTYYQHLQYVYIDASGATQTEYIDVSALVLEAEFASGITVTNHIAHGVVDPTSEVDSQESPVAFLTVGAGGFKLSGIKAEIERKINALDVSDTAEAGKYVSQVSETDGKISVSRADVSGAVLNNYSKGSDGAAVAATDTLNQAISKLEVQVDKAKAAATTEVVEGTDNAHIAVTSGTSSTDNHTIYTITATDVASESALTAEITARKAIDGQNGQTYTANSSANYIAAAESLNDADVKLDAALKSEADRAKSAETAIDSAVGLTKGENVETRTWTPTTNYSGASATVKANMQAIDTQVKANETAITLLNNTSAVTGSVKEQVATAKGEIIGTSEDTSSTLTLNGLKKAIEEAAAAATTVVAKDAQASHLTLSSATTESGATTYTIGESDIASDSEVTNIETAVGLNADGTYSALTGNYVSANGIDSIAKAIKALDTVIGPKNDTAAHSGDTVYGKIQGTWERVRGTNGTSDADQSTPTLWSLKKDIEDLDAKAAAAHTKVDPKNSGHVTVTVVDSADTTGGTTYKRVTIDENDIASANYVGTFTALDSETTVVAHAEKYTDSAVTALDNSFQRITDSEITALFT